MALKLWQDGVDNASVATIPENGNFKCVGSSYLVKKDPFAYSENKLILKDGFAVDLYDGVAWRQITNRAAIEFDPAENLDTGDTLSHGKDYYVYITLTGTTIAIVVSLNSTYPDGFNANNSRKIGGFHVGHIRKVSDDGLWVPIDSAGNKFGSSGTKWQDKNLWEGIYIPSVDEAITFMAGTNGLSVAEGKLKIAYGELPATGTEGLNQFNFNELAARQGLRLLSYDEWMQGAFGSPQGEDGSNNYGWTKTTNTARCRTGCQVDPSTGEFDNVNGVKPYAISAKNVVDCAGNVYEWTKSYSLDYSSATSWNWQNVLGANQGQAYLPNSTGLRALICGANWNNGVNCGPRTVNGNNYPWNVNTNIGSRLACDLTRSIKKYLG